MGDTTSIEWTDATWNPTTGCTKVSPGCDNCYAETLAERFRGTPGHYYEHGFDVALRPDKLDVPLRWKRPRRIFTNSMSDLFHADIPDDYIARVFAVMACAPRHTFQVLTKRHARMRSLLTSGRFAERVEGHVRDMLPWSMAPLPPDDHAAAWEHLAGRTYSTDPMPALPGVWLGVSVEDQRWADVRVPALLATPAAVRFLSCEPLLGPVSFRWATWASLHDAGHLDGLLGIDWVIAGGESGRGARPMHPGWARTLRDQCQTAGVAYLFKQWGAWAPTDTKPVARDPATCAVQSSGVTALTPGNPFDPVERGHPGWEFMRRGGKHTTGRVLDGRTWDEYPSPVTAGVP